jgi:hypothetical protein
MIDHVGEASSDSPPHCIIEHGKGIGACREIIFPFADQRSQSIA